MTVEREAVLRASGLKIDGMLFAELDAERKVSAELLAALRWCVNHSGECLGDHPNHLGNFRSIVIAAEGRA